MKETMNKGREDMEIDLQKLLMVYLKNWWIILLCGLIVAGGALIYSKQCITPLYRASVTVYVNNAKSSQTIDYITGSNLTASQQLVSTYVNIIQSDTVLTKVVESGGLDYTPEQVRSIMSASQVGETELFTVSISHPDPQMAAHIANAVADVAPAEIAKIVEGSSTKIIDYAKVPQRRYTPSYSRNTMLGGLVGCVLAVGFVTLRYLLDVRIKDEEDLTQLFDLPVLGQIPAFTQTASKQRYGYETQSSAAPAGEKGRGTKQ